MFHFIFISKYQPTVLVFVMCRLALLRARDILRVGFLAKIAKPNFGFNVCHSPRFSLRKNLETNEHAQGAINPQYEGRSYADLDQRKVVPDPDPGITKYM